jgi:hypothetical protein
MDLNCSKSRACKIVKELDRELPGQGYIDKMTVMEKKVMVWLCTKAVADTGLYEMDKDVQNLTDWVLVSGQIKENNNIIRNLTWEYNQLEPKCRECARERLESMKELCREWEQSV